MGQPHELGNRQRDNPGHAECRRSRAGGTQRGVRADLDRQGTQASRDSRSPPDTDLEIAFDALYTAARLSVTALLATQGLRPTTKGGHVAPIKAVRAQLGVHAKVLRSYDRLRVTRNRTDYPSPGATLSGDDVQGRHPAGRRHRQRGGECPPPAASLRPLTRTLGPKLTSDKPGACDGAALRPCGCHLVNAGRGDEPALDGPRRPHRRRLAGPWRTHGPRLSASSIRTEGRANRQPLRVGGVAAKRRPSLPRGAGARTVTVTVRSTTRSTTSLALNPDAAALRCSQARCRQAVPHQVGTRPRDGTLTDDPHHPHGTVDGRGVVTRRCTGFSAASSITEFYRGND